LRTSDEPNNIEADQVEIESKRFQVMKIIDNRTGQYGHMKVILLEDNV
jgi:hypothetical protein